MRLFLSLLFAVLVLFQYDFWFGKNGYWDYKNTTKEIAVHQQENEKLSQRNQIITAEIKDLKEGVDAIEERARSQHEMVKPNETFYHIVKKHKKMPQISKFSRGCAGGRRWQSDAGGQTETIPSCSWTTHFAAHLKRAPVLSAHQPNRVGSGCR